MIIIIIIIIIIIKSFTHASIKNTTPHLPKYV